MKNTCNITSLTCDTLARKYTSVAYEFCEQNDVNVTNTIDFFRFSGGEFRSLDDFLFEETFKIHNSVVLNQQLDRPTHC